MRFENSRGREVMMLRAVGQEARVVYLDLETATQDCEQFRVDG
jgi:hypothetical protein